VLAAHIAQVSPSLKYKHLLIMFGEAR
jgi:hypothetical protein